MTMEEKLALLKNSGVTVMGDLVLEKNVENEFGVIEAGGIGIQYVNGTRTKDARKKTASSSQIIDDVFTYKYIRDSEGQRRLVKFYQYLLAGELIHKDTSPDDFCAIFRGTAKAVTVKWMKSQGMLFMLINRLIDRKLITLPQGQTIWVVTGSHFLGKDSRPFTNWNKQKELVKSAPAMDRLADVLDITIPLDEE